MIEQHFTTEELATEEWRAVVGYEGFYEVSSLGRVRSLYRWSKHRPDRLRQLFPCKGYCRCILSRAGEPKSFTVHVLVMAAFVGLRPEGMVINHKDAVKINNRIENLEYVTVAENAAHAARMGLMPSGDNNPSRRYPERRPKGETHYTHLRPETIIRGERHHSAVLSDQQLLGIRERRQKGEKRRALAAEYGVTPATISLITSGKYPRIRLLLNQSAACSSGL